MEKWGSYINRQWEANLLFSKIAKNLSSQVPDGADTLHVPDIYTNTFSASDKSTGSEVTLNSPATAEDQLSISSWKEVSFLS